MNIASGSAPRSQSGHLLLFRSAKMPVYSGASATGAPLGARLFFENNVLWETAVKLAIAIEDGCETRALL